MRKIYFIGLILLSLAPLATGALPTGFKIEEAVGRHAGEVQDFHKLMIGENGEPSRHTRENLVENDRVYIISAPRYGIVGYAVVRSDIYESEATLRYFGIHPDFRGRGFAKELSTYVQRELVRKNIKTLKVPLAQSEKAAKRFFESQGFETEFYESRVSGDLREPGPVLTKPIRSWRDENTINSYRRTSTNYLGLPPSGQTLYDFLGVSPYTPIDELTQKFIGLAKEKNRRELGSEGYRMAFAVLFHDETREKYASASLHRSQNMGFVNVLFESLPPDLKRAYAFPDSPRELEMVRKYAGAIGAEDDLHDPLIEFVDMAETAHQHHVNESMQKLKAVKSIYDLADLVEAQIGNVRTYRFLGEERVYDEIENKIFDLAVRARNPHDRLDFLEGILQVDSALYEEKRLSHNWFENAIGSMNMPTGVRHKLELLKSFLDTLNLSVSARGSLFAKVFLNEMEVFLNKHGDLKEIARLSDIKQQYAIQLSVLEETEEELKHLSQPLEQSMRYQPEHVRRALLNEMREQRGGQIKELLAVKALEFGIATAGIMVTKGIYDFFPFLSEGYYRYINSPLDFAENTVKLVFPAMAATTTGVIAIKATLDMVLDSWPFHKELGRWDSYRDHRDRKRTLQKVLQAEQCSFEGLGN